MSAAQLSSSSALFGSREYTSVSRALGELEARRPVQISAPGETLLILPVEELDNQRLTEFVSLCRPARPALIITQQRALALGLNASTSMVVRLPEALDAGNIFDLVAERKRHSLVEASTASSAAAAAIQFVKLSRGLPAVLAASMIDCDVGLDYSIVGVDVEAVDRFAIDAVNSLVVASEALVPLASGVTALFIVFRDATGTDQVAIIVGKPDFTQPVPVRLHSACLTGDVFGSRRCDCGDQLGLALTRVEDLGGGVVLYSPRKATCKQDEDLSIAGRRSRYLRCKHNA